MVSVMTAPGESVSELQKLWILDPETVYLNHGSFGPAPLPVLEAREAWSRRLQCQPMRFFCREMEAQLENTAAVLAGFLHTKPDRLALVDNATLAMNIVAETVDLNPGDEILLTDHEYGAVRNIWSARCQRSGARLVTATLPFPPTDQEVVRAIAEKITPTTRVLVVSHVTSATACILPVRQIGDLARRHGIPLCVDGPHAVAMLDPEPDLIGCDFYCGSCHKWLCAPFGSGFVWVHPRFHARVRCPTVSWGGSIAGRPATWQDRINWPGTRDPAALLSISAAVEFFSPERLALFRHYAHDLLVHARRQLLQIDGVSTFCTPEEQDFVSMFGVELPRPANWKAGYHGHPDPLQLELRDDHGIEVPVASWNGRRYMRISAHLYNTFAQMDLLLHAVGHSRNLR